MHRKIAQTHVNLKTKLFLTKFTAEIRKSVFQRKRKQFPGFYFLLPKFKKNFLVRICINRKWDVTYTIDLQGIKILSKHDKARGSTF